MRRFNGLPLKILLLGYPTLYARLTNDFSHKKQVFEAKTVADGYVLLKKEKIGLKAPKRADRLYIFVFLFDNLFVGFGFPCGTRLSRFIRQQIYCLRQQIYCLKTTNLLL